MAQVQIVPFVAAISAPYQLWVGSPAVPLSGTNMAGRREMFISNIAGTPMFWGSGTSINQTNGNILYVGDQMSIPHAGSIIIYGAGSGIGSCDIRITEFA